MFDVIKRRYGCSARNESIISNSSQISVSWRPSELAQFQNHKRVVRGSIGSSYRAFANTVFVVFLHFTWEPSIFTSSAGEEAISGRVWKRNRGYTQSSSVPLPGRGPAFLMFSLTIFPRCFSRLAFLGNRANTARKAALSVAFQRYSLLLHRTMASASGNGEGEKPKHTNRLQHSKSPYLLQHKHNPVDW